MWQFNHRETIEAPAELVFELIRDIPNYKSWNPFLIEADGTVAVGGVIEGKSALGPFTVPFRHKIFELEPGHSLCWRDFGFSSYFVCGQRSRYVENINGVTHFSCDLKISGPLSGLVNILFGKGLRNGIVAEAKALAYQARNKAPEK